MVIKRGAKIIQKNDTKIKPKAEPKLPIKEESSYARIKREREEREAREEAKLKQQKSDAIEEKKRKAVIIRKYLTKLDEQIKEKNLNYFWTFPDRSGFKKIGKGLGYEKMQKLIQKDIDKYSNRQIMYFSIRLMHNKSDTSTHREYDTWLLVDTLAFKINSKGDLKADGGCHYVWKDEDFQLTKFSFKLLETIMYPVSEHKLKCISLMGYPLSFVIDKLKKEGVSFKDVLSPLAYV